LVICTHHLKMNPSAGWDLNGPQNELDPNYVTGFTMERKLFSLGSLVHYRGSSYTSFLTPSEAPHPWFITGFSDAESCFSINIRKNKEFKSGWRVEAHFYIGLHKKDLAPERVDEQARCPLCPPRLIPVSHIIHHMGEEGGGGYRVTARGTSFPL